MSTHAVQGPWVKHALAVVLLLSMTSGIVDVAAFLRYHVFVANQTGNLVIVALSFVDGAQVANRLPSFVALVAFTLGVFSAVWLRNGLAKRNLPDYRLRQILLGLEVALIIVTALFFALPQNPTLDLLCIALLSWSQAIQGVVITRFVGIAVQTVVINNAIIAAAEEAGKRDYSAAFISASTVLGYAAGAAIGAILLGALAGSALVAAVFTAFAAAIIVRHVRIHGGAIN